jgi:NarL family two-component system response regulator LiaR
MKKPVRILIVEDHTLVRKGIRALLESKHEAYVIDEAASAEEAVHMARSLRPDVILMDLVLPGADGVSAIRQIRSEIPDARILVLTSFGQEERIFSAIKAGALGYLLKDTSPQQLLDAIRSVRRGEPSLSPKVALKVIREIESPTDAASSDTSLTDREVEVLELVAQGLSNQQIADSLGISQRTVGTHVSNILAKLHLANRTQAALYALREGFADLK